MNRQEADMDRNALQEQRIRLYAIWDAARIEANEFRSVGMEPPADKEMTRRAIGRKLARIGKQLKTDDFDQFDFAA